ncbi:beta-xylosidase/alpha-l-arabinosidase [Streptomyces pathocidini]|uniref:beta-xylosidase/alpha-l-arabinosidase n=1 Tax=Streptomyces pathocidini TaxID=1650571 RepID=UPI0006E3FF03|nr:glycoside hydrolase family 3 N-terminal domain-containing protein [Streptomyces pathocidini]
MGGRGGAEGPVWRDPARPVHERVADLLARMTLEEKAAQTHSVWLRQNGTAPEGGARDSVSTEREVAPHQHDFIPADLRWDEQIAQGLGHLTRHFGTAPVAPADGARTLARLQREIAAGNRFGIPAIAHEECLAGFTAWQATIYPTPLAWGAAFDPALVRRMAERIGASMRSVGVHQGLAPVLDVVRDPRWGRTEETIGEDPYLVATVATAYVAGLESAGIVATLKHFVGYSASRAGRNLAPAAAGPREVADVLLPPFEMAIRDGGARSVMHAYTEVDGVPSAADPRLLTELLRDAWGFTGTVVADYFGVSFLEALHGVAGDPGDAARLALTAGVDVELPAVRCYGAPLLEAVRAGAVPEALVDRAAARVLTQKCELGMLDPDWTPEPWNEANGVSAGAGSGPDADVAADTVVDLDLDLDPPESRALARTLAEESVVLLANDGALPLRPEARIALVGPLADDVAGFLGCYAFPAHVGPNFPHLPVGVELPTVLRALKEELPHARVEHASGGEQATAAAGRADVCVAVLGDRAGLFGGGTSGEGCDAEDLRLPDGQGELLEALLATGTPVVAVLLTGRPYALGEYAPRLSAAVQAFFPGEEGGPAVAGVLSGRVCPSGRLPVSVPRRPGSQPSTYLSAPLGMRSEVSNIDPTPLYPFGHGLSYTTFAWEAPAEDALECATDSEVTVSFEVGNTGQRAGTEVVQLYLHDPVAQVTRPVNRLIGYARVPLEPDERRRVSFTVHADLSAYTGPSGTRIVEPGALELRLAASSADIRHVVRVRLTGEQRPVDHHRALTTDVTVE